MIPEVYVTGNEKMDEKIAKALEKETSAKSVRTALSELVFSQDAASLNKYHVSRKENRQLDNTTFASKVEKEDYRDLKYQEKAGEIFDLVLQPRIELIPANDRYKAIIYQPDAMYRKKDGKVYVQDSKGMLTDVYKLKRKLLYHVHPELILVESYRKGYADL